MLEVTPLFSRGQEGILKWVYLILFPPFKNDRKSGCLSGLTWRKGVSYSQESFCTTPSGVPVAHFLDWRARQKSCDSLCPCTTTVSQAVLVANLFLGVIQGACVTYEALHGLGRAWLPEGLPISHSICLADSILQACMLWVPLIKESYLSEP